MADSDCGLSPDAVLLFELLVDHGEELTDEISADSGLSKDRCDAAISVLTRSGLTRVSRTESGRIRIGLGSAFALRRLLDGTQDGVPASAIKLLRARMTLASALHDDGSGLKIRRVTDLGELQEQLELIGTKCRRELISLHAGLVPEGRHLNRHKNADLDLVRRGVNVRVVYPIEYVDSEELRGYAESLDAAGAQIRFADALPHRLVVCDGMRAVVPIDASHPQLGALIVTEPTMARSLRHLAMSIFRRGQSLGSINEARTVMRPPTPLEERVLILMSSGMTDELAAKQLSITARTFRRYVADILAHLGASSRFQAGVLAVERGWL